MPAERAPGRSGDGGEAARRRSGGSARGRGGRRAEPQDLGCQAPLPAICCGCSDAADGRGAPLPRAVGWS